MASTGMSNRSQTILSICKKVAQDENLRVTVGQSAKGAGIVGLATLAGGLLGGRSGLVVGGTLGSLASYLMTTDFKSVIEIIDDVLTPEQKAQLANQIGKLFQGIKLKNLSSGMILLANNKELKNKIVSEMSNYFNNELSMSIA